MRNSWHAGCLSAGSDGVFFTWQGCFGVAGVGGLIWARLCVCAEPTGDDIHSPFPRHLTEIQVGPHQLDIFPALIWWLQWRSKQAKGGFVCFAIEYFTRQTACMYCRCDYISLKCKLSWKWVATLALLEKNESNTMAAKSRRVTADWRHFGLWSQRHLLHISADAVEADFCCCLTGALPVGKGRQMEVVSKKHDRALRITQSLRALVGLFYVFRRFILKTWKN